jgi:hypothetical protein
MGLVLIAPPAHALRLDGRFTAEQKKRVIEDLQALFHLPEVATSPLHEELFHGPSSGETYRQYIETRVAAILLDPDESICGPQMKACASHDVKGSKSPVWLTPYYFRADVSQAERLSVIIHEATHIEGYPHTVLCFGQALCDDSLYSARGAEFIFIAHMLAREKDPEQIQIWKTQIQKASTGFRGDVLPLIQQLLEEQSK